MTFNKGIFVLKINTKIEKFQKRLKMGSKIRRLPKTFKRNVVSKFYFYLIYASDATLTIK